MDSDHDDRDAPPSRDSPSQAKRDGGFSTSLPPVRPRSVSSRRRIRICIGPGGRTPAGPFTNQIHRPRPAAGNRATAAPSESDLKPRRMTDSDDDQHVCGSTDTGSGDPCQFPVASPDDTCHMHGDDGPPEGHGSGDPDHRFGDGQPPDGNRNGLSHGLYAAERDPFGLFDHFREENPAIAEQIRRWFWSYMDDAPFQAYPGDADRYSPPVIDAVDVDKLDQQQDAAEVADGLDTVQVSDGPPRQYAAADAPPVDVQSLQGKASRLFTVCVEQAVTMLATVQQVEEGLTTERPATDETGSPIRKSGSGELVMIEDELPVNMPKSRMRQRDVQELQKLGVLDDPESQKADAMAGWGQAAKRVAERKGDHDA